MELIDQEIDAGTDYVTSWSRVPTSKFFVVQIAWSGAVDISNVDTGLTGSIEFEFSNDKVLSTKDAIFTAIIDCGNSGDDALAWEIQTGFKYWRVRYIANSIVDGIIQIRD